MAVTLEQLKKTVGKKKGVSMAFAWLADLERASGDLDGSLRRVNAGLQNNAADLPGMLVRSRILFERGEFEECIKECEKALKSDPFCLSAQKRMGDAYDQLGNEAERNKCYRRVHDMDPLDNFWKEEYDVVLATAAAVQDSDFVMPGLSGEGSDNASGEGLSFLSTGDSDGSLFVKENSVNPDEPAPEESSGIFEKSLDSSADSVSSIFSKSAEDNATKSPFEDFSIDEQVGSIEDADASSTGSSEDDPFAALADILPSDDGVDSSAMDNLQESLDAAMADIDSGDADKLDEFSEDDNISGGDVSNVFASMFGDDSMEPEEETAESSPFNHLNIPNEVSPDDFNAKDVKSEDLSLTNDENLFGLMEKIDVHAEASADEENAAPEESAPAAPAAEDKPQSVDSAFASIFGEDELPEENPQNTAKIESVETPAEAPAAEPAEASAEETAEEDPLAELQEITPVEPSPAEPAPAAKPAMEDGPQSLDSAFASIFGEDELPEEHPQESTTAPAEETPADTTLSFGSDSVGSLNSIFGEDESLEESSSTEDDISAVFSDSSDVSVVKPDETIEPEQEPALGSLSEQVAKAEDELELPPIIGASEQSSGETETIEKEVDSALNSILGDDDLGLPETASQSEPAPAQEETPTPEEAPTQESTSAAIEERVIPSSADASLEAEVNGAFKGLFFTDDDSLPESEENGEPSNKGLDFLMSGDSDDEVSVGLIKDPSKPLDRGAADIDESLNTKTLAEIYFEQGLYGKALDIYQDLCMKEPKNAEYRNRLEEIEKIYREKFGGNVNG